MGPVTDLQERFSLYAEHFPTWSEHASGMAQFAVWTALAAANIGASLQHYIPFADAAIRERWDIPDRKSTRLNSSHVAISYAVFCLIKKEMNRYIDLRLP